MTRETEQIVSNLAETVAESMGLIVLETRFIRHQKRHELRITLDRMDQPVSVNDCADFSRQMSRRMDLNDPISGSYVLEVSSPGFRRLIRLPVDLPRFVGHRVKIRLNESMRDRLVWIGMLQNETDPIHLMTDEIGSVEIPFSNVRQMNLHE